MQYTTLDGIVRSVLNQKGYTIHWYFQYLKLAADCLRELHFDTLKAVQAKKIPVNTEDNSVTLPCDYADHVRVGIINGQVTRGLVLNNRINRLNNFDDSGNVVRYDNETTVDVNGSIRYIDEYTNVHGENIGRAFGHRSNNMIDSYREIRERGVIQLSEQIAAEYVVLEYTSDGTGLPDAATKIHPYAQRAIETYIEWKSSPNRNNTFSPEAQQYFGQVRILRGRLNPLTIADIRSIINRAKWQAPK